MPRYQTWNFTCRRVALTILEFFLPRLCVFCGVPVGVAAPTAVCPACEGQIHWTASPLCPRCGVVFVSREGEDHLCHDCQKDPPPFKRARAAALYDGPAADAIRRFKYSRRLDYLPVMQHWLTKPHCLELAAAADLIVPVPLHGKRLKERGFNQAVLLARAFTQLPLSLQALVRVRHTAPQAGLKPHERRDNVRRAFQVPQPELIQDKKILLIDDVYTTGATVRECAKALLQAGARQVEVLTVARARPS